ncbi:T9SS type A sorting domain-containing protein, partial [bacterium]
IIRKPGTYTACAWVDYPYDSKHDDDTVCVTFDVELGIKDTITVGHKNELILPESSGVDKSSENQNGGTTQDAMKVEVAGANFNFNGFTSNPASSVTTINYDSKEPLTLQVVDMSGNIVFTKQVDGTSYNLDVTRFASGAYTVLLRNESGLQSRQLSVIK